LIESVVLAGCGGALGLVAGATLTDGILTLVPNLPRVDRVAPDATVVLFTTVLSLATGIVFGVVPALRTSRPDVRATLNEGPRSGDSRSTGRLRSALVVAELALSLVLLIGAALLVQSLSRVLTVDTGYQADHLLTLEYRLPRNKYASPEEQAEFHDRVIEAIAGVPGVEVTSLARAAALSGNGGSAGYWRAEDSQPRPEDMRRAQVNIVSAGYFRAMRIPVLAGRVCDRRDTVDSPITVIVNQHLAERLWPGESPVGRQLRSPELPIAMTIAGVVGNTRPQMLAMPVTAQIYGCWSQQPGLFATVIARTTGDPMSVARSVQQAIWSVDPDQPMWKIRSGDMLISGSVETARFAMLLMSAAAALALLLAALGTYSVLSYTVQRRSRELGVRIALGATRVDIARLVLSRTALLVAIGVVLGTACAFALSRLLATQLFEVSPRDPLTFVATSVLLAAVALVAAWLPTRRAVSLDPVITLRTE
jgi:putative ABC transport system permease protein